MNIDFASGTPVTFGVVVVVAVCILALVWAARRVNSATTDATAPIHAAIEEMRRDVKDRLDELANDVAMTGDRLADFKLEVSKTYPSKDGVRELLELRFDAVEAKLAGLLDMITLPVNQRKRAPSAPRTAAGRRKGAPQQA